MFVKACMNVFARRCSPRGVKESFGTAASFTGGIGWRFRVGLEVRRGKLSFTDAQGVLTIPVRTGAPGQNYRPDLAGDTDLCGVPCHVSGNPRSADPSQLYSVVRLRMIIIVIITTITCF
jgi:hypothetical protein